MTDEHPDQDHDDDPDEPSRWPTWALVAAVVAVVALVTAWAAGLQLSPPAPGGTDAVRLGPTSGEPVDAYLSRVRSAPAAAADPADPAPRLALVQFAGGLDADAAARVLPPGVTAVQAVFRLDLPRVQTAVRRLSLTVIGGPDAPGAVADAVRAAETQAANQARAQARASDGRAGAVATTEADALSARCACVLALVVRGAPAALGAVAGREGVRAVEVAPPAARPEALAVSPLLPEQTAGSVVGPVPDDGPVG